MRAVNLIPPDERGSDHGTMRTGAFSYVLIGALALALLGMIALAFTSKQVSDRKSEVAKLTAGEQQAEAKAQSLQAFANFRAVQQQLNHDHQPRAERFDWQRVISELARDSFQRLARPARRNGQSAGHLTDAPEIQIRDDVASHALELVGCATSRDAVAGFVSALEGSMASPGSASRSSGKVDDGGSIGGAASTSASGEDTNTGVPDHYAHAEVRDRRRLRCRPDAERSDHRPLRSIFAGDHGHLPTNFDPSTGG
jgi:hypothetical protein